MMKAYLVGVMICVASAVAASGEPLWKPGPGGCMTPVHTNRSALRMDAAMLDALQSVGIAVKAGFSETGCRESTSIAWPPAPARIYLAGQRS